MWASFMRVQELSCAAQDKSCGTYRIQHQQGPSNEDFPRNLHRYLST